MRFLNSSRVLFCIGTKELIFPSMAEIGVEGLIKKLYGLLEGVWNGYPGD